MQGISCSQAEEVYVCALPHFLDFFYESVCLQMSIDKVIPHLTWCIDNALHQSSNKSDTNLVRTTPELDFISSNSNSISNPVTGLTICYHNPL